MSVIIIPSRRTRQPQRIVRPSLAVDPRWLWYPALGRNLWARGSLIAPYVWTNVVGAGADGVSVNGDASAYGYWRTGITAYAAFPVVIAGVFTVTDAATVVTTAVGVGDMANSTGGIYGGVGQYTANKVSSWLVTATGGSDAPIDGPTAVAGQTYRVVRITRAVNDHVMFVNGVRYTSTTSTSTLGVNVGHPGILAAVRWSGDSAPLFKGKQKVYLGWWGDTDLGDAWYQEWSLRPWETLFPQDVRRIYFSGSGGAGETTGTASITQSPQTLTGAGAVAIAGSSTVTQAAQTATTAATVAVAGTGGITPAAQTLSATGAVVSGVVGSASITPAAQTLTSGAVVAISATATVTPSAQTLTGSAAVTGGTVTGTATITPAVQTLSATAAVSGGTVTGTANIYVNAQTLLALADIIVDGAATIAPAAQTLLGLEAGSLPLEVPESSRILIDRIERLGVSPTVYDPLTNRRVPASRKPPRLG